MNWLLQTGFSPRPLVVVEDHVHHIFELLQAFQQKADSLLNHLTVVCLDKRGPDTDAAVAEWLEQLPGIQIATRLTPRSPSLDLSCVLALDDNFFINQSTYCTTLAQFVRHEGILMQDIELETLGFLPRDRWWESTLLASTVRGILGPRPPRCLFISNKRGYEATFGAELLAAGHDPRDVLNKYDLGRTVIPLLHSTILRDFPFVLHHQKTGRVEFASPDQKATPHETWLTRHDAEFAAAASVLDLVLWPSENGSAKLSGRCFVDPENRSGQMAPKTIELTTDGNEYQTWWQLLRSNFVNRDQQETISDPQSTRTRKPARKADSAELPGVSIHSIGQRIAPPGALRAEVTNAAARHIHALRKRLTNPKDIVTTDGRYHLRDRLQIGIVTPRQADRNVLGPG